MQLTKTYPNASERVIDIVTVTATDDADTVSVQTAHDGVMMICRHDSPQMWQQLQALGLVPA